MNEAIAVLFFVVTTAVGSWLVAYGIYAGLVRRKMQIPNRRGEYHLGRAAVAEGLLRIAVGSALIALVVWVFLGCRP